MRSARGLRLVLPWWTVASRATSMSTVAHIRTDAGRTIREELVGFGGMVGVSR